jgi:Domain of unknown function (DUF4157)
MEASTGFATLEFSTITGITFPEPLSSRGKEAAMGAVVAQGKTAKGPEEASRQTTECCTQPGKASANNPLWARLATSSRAEALSSAPTIEQEADRFADAITTGSSMDAIRPPTTRGPQHKCTQCGGDASGECAHCADEDATLQFKADGPGANSQASARTQSQIAAMSGDASGRPLPQALRGYYEPRLGIELSGIRLHTDRRADALARQVNAFAFTYGRDIAFRAGYYAPDSNSGKRLLSHELAHVVQQQGASAAPALQRKVADASVPVGPTNPDYVNKYSSKILLAISERIQAVGAPQPHGRIRWSMAMADVGQAIGEAIYDYVRAVPDTDLKRLMLLSYPADLFALVDRARRGPEGGRLDAVRVAIATAFDEPLMASIQRMGMRLCTQMDTHGGNKPQASSIVASSPLDGVIAGVLVKPGLTSYTFKKKGAPDDTRGKPFAKGARVVKYEWLGPRDSALWNWIKVTSPVDATAEDVANTALAGGEAGDTEQAYRIAVSPPYFGIPFETARLIPEAEKYAPTDLRIKLSSGPGPRVADPSALARSVVSDDAALTQAPAPAKDDLPVDRALPRIDLQLEFIRTQLQPWGADAALTGATAFVKRRYAEITQDKKHGHRWQAALAAQERILHTASADLADVVLQLTDAKASPSDVPGPIMQLLIAYARAAGASHIHEQARAALAEARRLRDFLPIALAEARIEDATAQVAQQREAEASAKSPEKGADRTLGNLPDLMTRSADLRLQVIRGEKLDPDDVEMLSVDASETDLRAYLLTLATRARTVMDKADDVGLDQDRYPSGAWSVHMISGLILKETRGWMDHLDQARKWVGPARGLSAKQTDAKRMKDAIASVTSEASKFSKQLNEDGEYLKWAYEQITDKELRDLVFSMAVQMGVMLVTGQALGAIGTAVRGIALAGELGAELREASLLYRGAGIIAEATVNTSVQAAMGEKVGVREFAENTLGIVLTHAALKPFQGLLRDSAAIEGEIRTWGQLAKRGGRAAAELVVETGAGIGAAGVAHALTHGGETSAMSSEEWVMQGLSLTAGKFVHQAAAKMHDRIQVAKHDLNTNAFDKLLSKVEVLETRATKKVSSPEEAIELMAERHKLLVEERNLYSARPEGKKAHAEVEKELAATAEQFVDAPLQLAHLSAVVEGQIFEGSSAQIKSAIAAAEATGVPMVSVGDPQDGIWRVGKRAIKIVEVVPEQQIETALKHIQEHPEVIQAADRPGKRHAPAGEGHEVVEVSGPSGIVCEFHSMGRRRVACPWPRGKGPKVGKEILDAWPQRDIGPGQPIYQLTGDNGQFRSSKLGYHVYEYFNEKGELLYVGKSGSISEKGSRVEHVEPETREAPTKNWIDRLRSDHIHKFWITEARFVRVTYDLSETEMWALEKSRIPDARENIQPGKYPRESMGSYFDDVKHAGRRPQVYFRIEAQRTPGAS